MQPANEMNENCKQTAINCWRETRERKWSAAKWTTKQKSSTTNERDKGFSLQLKHCQGWWSCFAMEFHWISENIFCTPLRQENIKNNKKKSSPDQNWQIFPIGRWFFSVKFFLHSKLVWSSSLHCALVSWSSKTGLRYGSLWTVLVCGYFLSKNFFAFWQTGEDFFPVFCVFSSFWPFRGENKLKWF